MARYIICCDWGTSSLRSRLLDSETEEVIDDQNSSMGIARVKQLWEEKQAELKPQSSEDRIRFYLNVLHTELSLLMGRNEIAENAPLIISGMASSNIGMLELPYADLPFNLNGSNATIQKIAPSPEFNHQVVLISGVKAESDVMRGEEVQAMGIADFIAFGSKEKSIVLLPGTHSKHLHIKGDTIIDIETYITGELFGIVSNNGLLRDAVELPEQELSEKDWEIFLQGVAYSGETILLHSLFKIRTNFILNKLSKKQNSVYLSGLLIGDELRTLLTKEYDKIVLCTDDKLFEYYKRAILHLGLKNISFMDPGDFVKATIKGQFVLAKAYL